MVTRFHNTTLGSCQEIWGRGRLWRQEEVLRVRSMPFQAWFWHFPAARPARASGGGHARGSWLRDLAHSLITYDIFSVFSKIFSSTVLNPLLLSVAQGP